MLDTAHALWVRRMRQMDDAVRAWASTPPQNEATLLHHLGLLDEIPGAPDDRSEETFSWDELSKRFADNPVTEG
ncbi:MAG: hypothetical protein JWO62_2640 [Acidimicrobiaceae bacterium]|nr:hypothetical protein [Acidimicrobiaceae bacterium]